MIFKWDMNFFCTCHCSLTNGRYNKAEDCICILIYERKWLFIIQYFVFDCLLLNTDFFLALTIYSWISEEIFKQLDVIPLFISRNSIWFSIKLWIFTYDFFRAIIQNVSTKKTVSTTKKGFYFQRSNIMLLVVCW